jgi:hypothetical protein
VGAEASYRASRGSTSSLGARFEWIDRTLDFATVGLGNRLILRENALHLGHEGLGEMAGRAEALRVLRVTHPLVLTADVDLELVAGETEFVRGSRLHAGIDGHQARGAEDRAHDDSTPSE